MKIFEFLQQKGDSTTEIGRFECDRSQLVNTFITLMDRLSMSNPTKVTSYSGKAVTVSRFGNKYTLVINTFQPPLKIEWTGTMDINQLVQIIDSAAASQKKIAYINTLSDAKGANSFQLALA